MEYAKDIILDIKDGQAVERKIKVERQLKKKRTVGRKQYWQKFQSIKLFHQ